MRIVLLLLMALVLSGSALAQQRPRPQLRILVEPPDEDTAKCGVSKSQLESITALTLRNNGIQVVIESTNPILHVDTIFLPTAAGSCAYHTRVSIQGLSQSDFARTPLGAFKARNGSRTELCSSGSLRISPRARAATDITQELETLIKQCLGELDY